MICVEVNYAKWINHYIKAELRGNSPIEINGCLVITTKIVGIVFALSVGIITVLAEIRAEGV